jgi:hypothetical protein
MGLLSPSKDINYNFVVGVYLAASVLCVLFYLGEVLGPEKDNPVQGWWIIFSPFLPCLLWATALRSQWLAAEKAETVVKKEL